ncbi:MAG: phenylalanine--tRNA ligase subunit beta [Candidatus Marinimicrobia bacterium]|nr:phenylalanine--tRNA ligase subunit beta [Candidatus Neomarinimicrobiota bacterium]
MILSIDWLKEFVDIKESSGELADILSSIGLEAEDLKPFEDLEGVVIGKVKSVDKHPNADRLSVCSVYDGEKDYQVVCGANNVAKGQTIAYAKVGSVLPGGFRLEKIKLRGVESSGMICSAKELNISDEHEGIMVLPESCIPGNDFVDEYGIKFLRIELDITPNRPDAFSHYGVARDIAVYKNRPLSKIQFNEKKIQKKIGIKISVEDNIDCPRYVGGLVKNVSVGPSPEWMQDRLIAAGQRPINNLVDISNFVLLEFGHPTHIFDYDKLDNKEIYVRRAKKNESITTLDQNKYKLNNDQLLITDRKSPIALAGIMGGFDSAVDNATKNIFIESAYFNPVTIRKGSKALFISTEASKRFERGADPEAAIDAFWRVLNLVEEQAGGLFGGNLIDYYPEKIDVDSIEVRKSELGLILGFKIKDDLITSILTGLGFSVTDNNNGFICIPPTNRPDITREIDIIEEIARIYGYDNIPIDNSLHGAYSFSQTDPELQYQSIIDTVSGLGFNQIYSNSLQSENIANFPNNNSVPMMNPLSKDMSFLRTSLLPGLVKAADYNIKNSTNSFKLFELDSVHTQLGNKIEDIKKNVILTGIIVGNEMDKTVHTEAIPYDIFSIKGYINALLNEKLHLSISIEKTENLLYEEGYNILIEENIVGTFGNLSKKLFKTLKVDKYDIYSFDLYIEMMIGESKTIKYTPINLLPKISRRINLVLEASDSVGPILEMVKSKGGKNLIQVYPIELFEDNNSLGESKKSVTFKMVFQDREKTLEDKDVNLIIDEIIGIAEKKFNAKLRV